MFDITLIAMGKLKEKFYLSAAAEYEKRISQYCRLNNITIQPWSPLQYGYFVGTFLDNPEMPELNAKLNELEGN